MSSLDITIFFNLTSLLLGLIALLLAGTAIAVRTPHRSTYFATGSFGLCALSLLLQIAEISHRVQLDDFSAVADTIGAVLFASSALFTLTGILNIAALLRRHGRR